MRAWLAYQAKQHITPVGRFDVGNEARKFKRLARVSVVELNCYYHGALMKLAEKIIIFVSPDTLTFS